MRIELNQAKSGLNLNQTFARQVMGGFAWIKTELNDGQINPIDILRYPGVVEDAGVDVDELSQSCLLVSMHYWMILLQCVHEKGKVGASD